jgi:hypothetical protein
MNGAAKGGDRMMDAEDTKDIGARIQALLTALAAREPVAMELGTPVLDESARELHELVGLGPSAVPHLLGRASGAPAREAAWIALALGRIGDSSALDGLRRLLASYAARANKQTWDFAVAGQAKVAIARLESR